MERMENGSLHDLIHNHTMQFDGEVCMCLHVPSYYICVCVSSCSIYVSSYYIYIYICPHAIRCSLTARSASFLILYMCVLILYIYVSSCCIYVCPRACPHTIYVCPHAIYMCVLMLCIFVSSCNIYICVLMRVLILYLC
jgi:hypothetical protein